MKLKTIILAGGFGRRLSTLTLKRAKPAVPFAGKYRIIDFSISNCVNSGLFDIVILTQYRPHSLNDHIRAGRPWDLDRTFTGGVQLLQPYKGRYDTDWYEGTANAVLQNLNFIRQGKPELVMILSGDQVYRMDYRKLIDHHHTTQADVTVGAVQVSQKEASRFGILETDASSRVTHFEEKPKVPRSNLASMGIYLFNYDVLERYLLEDQQKADSSNDFGKDIFPAMIRNGEGVFAYQHNQYWVDVGAVHSYWEAHMDLLKSPPSLDLNDRNWVIRTRSQSRPGAIFGDKVRVSNSIISEGVILEDGAVVDHSVLSPGVRVGKGAVVQRSIVLNDTTIMENALLDHVIMDKSCSVGARTRIGGPLKEELTCLGKNSHIPNDFVIHPGCTLGSDLEPVFFENYEKDHISPGETLGFNQGKFLNKPSPTKE